MVSKKYIKRKVFLNKKNNQLSVSIPKKKLKKLYPSIKFGEDLFVELRVIKGSDNDGNK